MTSLCWVRSARWTETEPTSALGFSQPCGPPLRPLSAESDEWSNRGNGVFNMVLTGQGSGLSKVKTYPENITHERPSTRAQLDEINMCGAICRLPLCYKRYSDNLKQKSDTRDGELFGGAKVVSVGGEQHLSKHLTDLRTRNEVPLSSNDVMVHIIALMINTVC